MRRVILARAALGALALALPADAQVGSTRIGTSVLYSQNGGTRVDWQPAWANRQIPSSGIAIGQYQPLAKNVPTGQHLIGLDMTLQNQNPTPGASQVYGLRCTNDSPTFDTGACIGLWTDEADGMFVGVEGKSGTGVGIQRNPRNRPDGAAYGYQCSSFGPGSCMYPRRQVNMNDWNQRLVKLRANNNAISIEQDSTRTPGHPLITVESPGGVGHELISTNDGSMARTAGAGDFWAGNQRVIVTGDTTIENPHGQVLLRVRADGCLVLKSGTMIC